ncbi:acyltransferase family protein [Algibacter lectus]|uniref:Acyltransferase family protein n=1 Tax=Algibacter lectus TaxID=221126 RepID=A0A090WN31_9FLAO|nr:acyltransferase family protein [Algibacter lectus]GAL77618.1 acyltransferase family protein [Algibacter lectus]
MERNITLDYTKLILSFLVVAIHNPILTELPFVSNLISNGIARIAVPCFFVINGLYLGKVVETPLSVKKYLKKLFKFYLVWMLIYSPPFYLFGFKDTIEKSIVLNIVSVFFGYWHLWYIIGLMGGVWLLYVFKQRKLKDQNIIIIAVLFFLIGWALQQARLFLPEATGNLGSLIRANFYSRNFIFMGFPLITVGYYLKKGFLIPF